MAYRVSDRVKDLSHSKALVNEREAASGAVLLLFYVPGTEHTKGFSPVCERQCETSAKRDVCTSPRRGHVAHSHL